MFRTVILRRLAPPAVPLLASRAKTLSHRCLQATLLLVVTLTCSSAMAAGYGMDGHRITNITTGWGGEGFYITTQGPLPAGADCGGGNHFILDNNHPMQREIVSMLLIAIQSKMPVSIYVEGCSNTSMVLKSVGFAAS